MNFLPLLPLHLFAVFLQAGTPAWPALGWAKPPFLLAIVLYAGLRYDPLTAAWIAVVGGLLQDSLDFVPTGVSSFGFLILVAGTQILRPYLFRDSLFTHLLLTLAGAMLLVFWTWAVLHWGPADEIPPFQISFSELFRKMLGLVILTPAACVFLYPLSRLFEKMLQIREDPTV